ncbi:HalD/BesD family halogenase [Candidatus Spongiihabitans sp.]|uniref:HalD/BesD family halogenase n=1 Tax=Candidatus Spongiihabitans sp. TaxID=3101308 RepID=UPI003C6F74AD
MKQTVEANIMLQIKQIIDFQKHPIDRLEQFAAGCKQQLEKTGSLLLPNFITDQAIAKLKAEALAHAHLAYYCQQTHTAYLSPPDKNYAAVHPRNRQVISTKGCITDDQIPEASLLRIIYADEKFRKFLCYVLKQDQLFDYADSLSSINVHYYEAGQELGWHFDNSSFAVTLMIQPAEQGGEFEYIPRFRNHETGDMNFEGVGQALDGDIEAIKLNITAGTLALFRGRNALHRVTPVMGSTDRIQVVLAYNTAPGITLSEQARLTFYGRTH